MNNRLSNSTNPPHNCCAFQAKGGSFDIGVFDNVVKDAGVRAVMMGGSTGPAFFHQGNIVRGWECYDSVAMGNKIVGGLWPISYSDADNIHFDYNTVVNPANGLLRILAESQPAPNPSSNGHYSHNVVQYGNVAEPVNTSRNTRPETFTFDGNYWYCTANPAASKPRLPGRQINDAGGADPQLDAHFDPHYGPAKAYGADAPGKDAAWLPNVNKFQWAWDTVQSYLPHARPAATNSSNGVTLDGGASTLGATLLRPQYAEVLWVGPGQRRQRRSGRHRAGPADVRETGRQIRHQEGCPHDWAEGVGDRRTGAGGLVPGGAGCD